LTPAGLRALGAVGGDGGQRRALAGHNTAGE
jgi:hypothetical protein